MRISELSLAEIVLIKGHFAEIFYVKCAEKKIEYIESGYEPEVAEKTVKAKNKCDIISKDAVQEIDNLLFFTCTCNFRHPMMNWFFDALAGYEAGFLPYGGCLADQPAKIMEAIYLLQALKIDYNIYMRKKHETKGSTNGR